MGCRLCASKSLCMVVSVASQYLRHLWKRLIRTVDLVLIWSIVPVSLHCPTVDI